MDRNRTKTSRFLKRAFTLIELLVVISIIALLVGILLPALSAARGAAQSAKCLASSRSTGSAMGQYQADNKSLYPTHYQYRATLPAGGAQFDSNISVINQSGNTVGYAQWSGFMIYQGYYSADAGLVCPTHIVQGWGPTDFTTQYVPSMLPDYDGTQQVTNSAAHGMDSQAARLSYVGNEMVMPRLKTGYMQQGLVSNNGNAPAAGAIRVQQCRVDDLDKASGTINFGEYTDYARGVYGSSLTGGAAIKTHRPSNALLVNVTTYTSTGGTAQYFDGEAVNDGIQTVTTLYGITPAIAKQVVADFATPGGLTAANMQSGGPVPNTQQAFGSPTAASFNTLTRHNGSANYTFCDGHSAAMSPDAAFDQSNWKWGTKAYTLAGTPQIYSPVDGHALK